MEAAKRPGSLDPRVLDLLVCPVTRGPLRYDEAAGELISPSAALAYPVRDGVAVLLAGEARPLNSKTVP